MSLALAAAITLLFNARRLDQVEGPGAVAALRTLAGIERSTSALQAWLASGDPALLKAREDAWRRDIQPHAGALRALGGTKTPVAGIGSILESIGQLDTLQKNLIAQGRGEGGDALLLDELHEVADSVRSRLNELAQNLENALSHQSALNANLLALLVAVLVGTTIASHLVGRLLVHQVAKSVVAPVEILVDGAQRLAAGRLDEDLQVQGHDELGLLARSLNKLRVTLALAEMKYRSLFAHTSNCMLLLDPDTFQILDLNFSFEALTGLKRRDMVNKNILDLFEGEHRKHLDEALHTARKKRKGAVSSLELQGVAGMLILLDVSIAMIEASTESVMEATFIDITEQSAKNKELSEIAFQDELTGLFNHRSFYKRLNEEIARSRDQERALVLLFIDLDNFKQCNDTHGHQVGDQLLRLVGETIRKHIRQDRDSGFRYGGDEFGVLLPDATPAVGERIAKQVRTTFMSGEQYGTSMSIGVAAYKPQLNAEAFVKAADEALYAAKSGGKNTIRISE